MPKREQWNTVSLRPLSGPLDIRSRPADIPAGAFRYKGNIAITDEGKLCRRDGFLRAFSDMLYDSTGALWNANSTGSYYIHNHDHHHQGTTRQPISFMFESTANDGTRRLFDATQDRISVQTEATGVWTDIASVSAPDGSRWKAAELQNYVLFTNGDNDVLAHQLGSTTTATIPELLGRKVTAAKVIVRFKSVMFLLNVVQGDTNNVFTRQISRIVWSDINGPLTWSLLTASSIAGAQDLDYGDEILAAAEMLDSLYIYTRRAIWCCKVAPPTAASPFTFTKVYSEPKNQTGCLVYPNTLVSTGTEHWYMSREGAYRFTPYLAAPERPEWLHRASGVIYRKLDTAMLGVDCQSPVSEYRPDKKELWFSWPSGTHTLNNWQLSVMIEHETGDVIDEGAVCYCNYRRNPKTPDLCNENQSFLFVSAKDWAIKETGGVFYREYAALLNDDPTQDLTETLTSAGYETAGYYSILRGMIPLGLTDRDKLIRNVLIDIDVSEQSPPPCALRLRIGNSYVLTDPNDTDDVCAPQWRQFKDKPLTCPDAQKISAMTAANLRPAVGTEWRIYEQGRFLYYELIIANQDGSPAIGGDACLQRVDFDAMAMPKV